MQHPLVHRKSLHLVETRNPYTSIAQNDRLFLKLGWTKARKENYGDRSDREAMKMMVIALGFGVFMMG